MTSVTEAGGSLAQNRDYVAYWLSRAFSVLGSQATYVAFPLMALSEFGSPLAASLVTASSYGSALLVGLHAGVLADRYDRKRLMALVELMQAGAMLLVTLTLITGRPSLILVCLAAFSNGALHAVFNAASNAALPDLVGAPLLSKALARNQSRDFMLALAGPSVGAALFILSPAAPFALNAGTFLVAAMLVTKIRRPLTLPRDVCRPSLGWSSMRMGVAHVRADPPLRYGLLFFAGQSFVLTASFFTAIALLVSGGHTVGAGIVVACQALGGLLGSFIATGLHRRLSGSLLLTLQGLTWSGGLALMAIAGQPVAIGFAFACLWLVVPATRIVFQEHLAAVTAPALRGRVQSVSYLAQSLLTPAGPLAAGLIIGLTSARAGLFGLAVVAGIVTLAAVVLPSLTGGLRWKRTAILQVEGAHADAAK
ncbi:MFS transporter [Thalassiella azotivora]